MVTNNINFSQGEAWKDTRTKVNPVMMQPKNVKSYVPVVHKIADEFVERIRAIRNENSEVPADFSNETNKWSLESIASIALDQRLHLMTNEDPKSDGQRLITVGMRVLMSLSLFYHFTFTFRLFTISSHWPSTSRCSRRFGSTTKLPSSRGSPTQCTR